MAIPLFLASSSPRRRQLLREAGIPFELLDTAVEEEALEAQFTGPLGHLGEYLARHKAEAGFQALQQAGKAGRVLASDTTVLLARRHLAKPRDLDEARAMLRDLRGREHIVATGLALAGPGLGQIASATSETRVLMRAYGDEEIERYVVTDDPLDKAGAYSIQHPAFAPVERITGCHLGVMGLPMCLVSLLTTGGAGVSGGICRWSSLCTEPFPGAADLHTGHSSAP